MKKFMLLGAGELAKEFIIAAQRYGFYTIAVDKYENAPGMQVAHKSVVIDMLNAHALDQVVETFQPDYIVPEIEAIKTERLFDYEQRGITVVPSAKAVQIAMNRKSTRDLATNLGLPTAPFRYANTLETFTQAVSTIGLPCVVKPLMSSSGKGQSVIRKNEDIRMAWDVAMNGSRGDIREVIVEQFIEFESEITLLTVTRRNKTTKFCSPIGHRQKNGDYQESWQPHFMSPEQYSSAKKMAQLITNDIGGNGVWGVEFFLLRDGTVLFSELSPRPHDTGLVTLATQYHNEFELHLRAILGWEIQTSLKLPGRSHVISSHITTNNPIYTGLDNITCLRDVDFRIFGKPVAYPGRRMGVVLITNDSNKDTLCGKTRIERLAESVVVVDGENERGGSNYYDWFKWIGVSIT